MRVNKVHFKCGWNGAKSLGVYGKGPLREVKGKGHTAG